MAHGLTGGLGRFGRYRVESGRRADRSIWSRLTHTGRFACRNSASRTVRLRIFGNSYPQSHVGIYPVSLAAVVRPLGGDTPPVVFGSSEGAMARRVFLVVGLSSALLSGCASVGNESIADATPESVSAQLIKGRTTQQNVRGLYGDPAKTSFTDSGNETWEYDFSRMHSKPTNFIPYVNLIHSGAEGDKKSLVIFFDRSKVVQQYTISSSKVDVSQGLITR
jgi:hypothetical protein